jgi:predicted GNAT family N-acyltransferase
MAGSSGTNQFELVELGELSLSDWAHLVRGDPAPFGPVHEAIEFRAKDHHVGLRDQDGRLVAACGVTVVTVEVEGHEPFQVAGVGALIVRKEMRGQGLAAIVMPRTTPLVDRLGPDRAMLFSETPLMKVYMRFGYRPITSPVWVDQQSGPLQMPLNALWRPIIPTTWPDGTVRVHGLPF